MEKTQKMKTVFNFIISIIRRIILYPFLIIFAIIYLKDLIETAKKMLNQEHCDFFETKVFKAMTGVQEFLDLFFPYYD